MTRQLRFLGRDGFLYSTLSVSRWLPLVKNAQKTLFLTPISLYFKILMLCITGLNSEENIPETIRLTYILGIDSEFLLLPSLSIPRLTYLHYSTCAQLHEFCDPSECGHASLCNFRVLKSGLSPPFSFVPNPESQSWSVLASTDWTLFSLLLCSIVKCFLSSYNFINIFRLSLGRFRQYHSHGISHPPIVVSPIELPKFSSPFIRRSGTCRYSS